MIRIEGLDKTLGGRQVLRGIDLTVDAGEVLAIVGPSGTGKSVLLKHVIGLLLPDAGDIRIAGRSIVHCSPRELTDMRRTMGYVFQDAALLDALSVRENLRLALDDRECRGNPMYAADRIHHALETVNLGADVLNRLPGELSGGMRKRVGVARAILNMPSVVLYDEPTTGLDPANVQAIDDLVLRTRDALGATSIVVTHAIDSLSRIADRVAFLCQGEVRFHGDVPDFLSSDDATVRSFLGTTASPTEEAHNGRLFARR